MGLHTNILPQTLVKYTLHLLYIKLNTRPNGDQDVLTYSTLKDFKIAPSAIIKLHTNIKKCIIHDLCPS